MVVNEALSLLCSGLACSGFVIAAAGFAFADAGASAPPPTSRATGTFDVSLTSRAADEKAADGVSAHLSLDKRFQGDIDGASKGQMLAADSGVEGSGAYVAIERVSGTLHGRTGTFMLQHSGWMTKAGMGARITVVPDSGTGELTGLAGTFTITIEGERHLYAFDYSLPAH